MEYELYVYMKCPYLDECIPLINVTVKTTKYCIPIRKNEMRVKLYPTIFDYWKR